MRSKSILRFYYILFFSYEHNLIIQQFKKGVWTLTSVLLIFEFLITNCNFVFFVYILLNIIAFSIINIKCFVMLYEFEFFHFYLVLLKNFHFYSVLLENVQFLLIYLNKGIELWKLSIVIIYKSFQIWLFIYFSLYK